MSFSSRSELEIERKFFVSDETIALLQTRCGQPQCIDMLDEYWDTGPSILSACSAGTTRREKVRGPRPYALSSADAWLRRRNDTWELKWPCVSLAVQVQALRARQEAPHQSLRGPVHVPADQYNEYTARGDIAGKLDTLGVHVSASSESPFSSALTEAGLSPFARIRTKRTRYELSPQAARDEGSPLMQGVTLGVDVDEVEYEDLPGNVKREPYRLAEVEVVVPLSSLTAQAGDSEAVDTARQEEALRQQAGQLADRLIAAACADYRIQTDYTSSNGESGNSNTAGPPRRIHGKVIEYLMRYDSDRLAACRQAGLLAIKTGEDMP